MSGLGVILARVDHKHLPILVAPEPVQIRQDADDGVALSTAYKISQRYPQRIRRLDHVKDLVLDVLKGDRLLFVLPHLLLDGAEEVVQREDGQMALVSHVEDSKEMLQGLRLLLVLHGEDKVQVGLVVHLALVGEALLEDALHKDGGEGAGAVAEQLSLAQHPVVVSVQVQVLTVHPAQQQQAQ